MRRFLACLCVSMACNDHEPNSISLTRSTQWVAGTLVVEGPAKVDVLLVVDDSPSMHDHAENLADNLRAIATVYEGERLDYRIGVISTHLSGPDCAAGRDGSLVRTSCRERLPSFVTSANQESPAVDLREVCTESCALERVEIAPSFVAKQDEARPRGWLERGATGQNTADPVASLTCLGQVGVGGCTAESPLGAVLRFLDRTEDPRDPDFGFVRADAGLAIILVGDEDDCSRSSPASLRGEGSVSAACWREGADCVQGDDGLSCEVASSSELVEVGSFVERLQALDADKRRFNGTDEQRVFVSAVAGVPSSYPDRPQTFEPGNDAAFERAFGIGAGCVRAGRVAAPSVRTVEAAEAFAPWIANVVSVCVENWSAALACLPGDSRGQIGPFCLDVELLGEDPELSGSCTLTEAREGQTRRLPECDAQCSEGTCDTFEIPVGADACVVWQTQGAQQACLESGFGAEAFVVRHEPSWETLEYEVSCAAEI